MKVRKEVVIASVIILVGVAVLLGSINRDENENGLASTFSLSSWVTYVPTGETVEEVRYSVNAHPLSMLSTLTIAGAGDEKVCPNPNICPQLVDDYKWVLQMYDLNQNNLMDKNETADAILCSLGGVPAGCVDGVVIGLDEVAAILDAYNCDCYIPTDGEEAIYTLSLKADITVVGKNIKQGECVWISTTASGIALSGKNDTLHSCVQLDGTTRDLHHSATFVWPVATLEELDGETLVVVAAVSTTDIYGRPIRDWATASIEVDVAIPTLIVTLDVTNLGVDV